MKTKNIQSIKEENEHRKAQKASVRPNPETGYGCIGNRRECYVRQFGRLMLPEPMLESAEFSPDMDGNAFSRLRFKYDFEYWLYKCVPVRDKYGAGMIPFVLNEGQRKVVGEFERMRLAGQPIRVIVLKARQWGCSTIVQAYMAWIQIIHKRWWNGLICAQFKDTSNILRQMYCRILDNYPEEFLDEEETLRLKPVSGSRNIYELSGRDNSLHIASAFNPEAIRGADLAMAHLSEVAFWSDTATKKPGNVVRAVCASVNMLPMTFVVLESTANGVGGYFHREWTAASAGQSDKTPVFVAWHEISAYSAPVGDYEALWDELDEYEMKLWEDGLTLEQINWYHHKRREYQKQCDMAAEYPSNPGEAFNATDNSVFSQESVNDMRQDCMRPAAEGDVCGVSATGPDALKNVRFYEESNGKLKVWKYPDRTVLQKNRYVVSVDIGGRSDDSDWSVIAVLDRLNPDAPEVAAQWRGHVDHDILAWKAAMIARWYCDALLIIESNTLETDRTEGDHGEFILHELDRCYKHLYRREDGKPGFHTNRATKTRVVNSLIAAYRDKGYVERSEEALNEALTYERKPRGTFGAKEGAHDDMVMSRALALACCSDLRRQEVKLERSAEFLRGLVA